MSVTTPAYISKSVVGDVPAGPGDFFASNDYNADYWYVTGVPVPAYI